ncbi:unnamed protein product [Oikopleura dioica]|uniref:Reverse transcriptase domain-containing protein n=1 Tax=Oikopleura dioica TaxID=34765 RepID=E4XV35_OIKDI|nr:unnamed protein product [Oikopleura dioica]
MDFTETYEILVNVPKDGGSLSEPILFYISAGVHNDSLNFYLQYGKKSRQFLMHVRECSSKAITLHCTHARSKSAKCKATVKILTALDSFQILTGFKTFEKIVGPEAKLISSAIDHTFVRNAPEATAKPLDMTKTLGVDGHLGIRCTLMINKPEDTLWELKKVKTKLPDKDIFKIGMQVDYEAHLDKALNRDKNNFCLVEYGQKWLEEFARRAQPLVEKVCAYNPYKVKRSRITAQYLKWSIGLKEIYLEISACKLKDRIVNSKILKRIRQAVKKMELMVAKLVTMDRRLAVDENTELSMLNSTDSWRISKSYLKEKNVPKIEIPLDQISKDLLELQLSTVPPKTNIPPPKIRELEDSEKLRWERVFYHESELYPSFAEAYKTNKKDTSDLHLISRNLVELGPCSMMNNLVLQPCKYALSKGVYIEGWKVNKVRPLLKQNKKLRPITICSFLAGIIEKIRSKSLTNFLIYKNILPRNQYGFRAFHSCAGAAFHIEKLINGGIGTSNEKGKPEGYPYWAVVTCDAKNAFGVVTHELLLDCLSRVAAPEVVAFIAAFLKRSFRAVLNGYTSQKRDLPEWGLPQGSPMSPILYSLFTTSLINDVSLVAGEEGTERDDVPCKTSHPVNSETLIKGTNRIKTSREICQHGNEVAVGLGLGFADDLILLVAAHSPTTLLRYCSGSVTRTLEKMQDLGIAVAPQKTALVLFGKEGDTEENIEILNKGITVRETQVLPSESIKYLGIRISAQGGKFSLQSHYKYLKARFRKGQEQISTIFGTMPKILLANIARSMLMGVGLFGAEFSDLRDKATLASLQNTLNNTIENRRNIPFYMTDLARKSKEKREQYYKEFKLNFNKTRQGHCPDEKYVSCYKYNIPPCHFLMMQSSITNLHKIFKYRSPDFPQIMVKEVMWICNKFGEKICKLPDIFRAHRLETEMINRTKFGHNRVPGIFTADETRELWVARNYTSRLRAIMNTGCLEIKLISEGKNENWGFHNDKKIWPGNIERYFNSLPTSIRNSFVTDYFPTELKQFINTCHFHENHSFTCEICEEPVPIMLTKEGKYKLPIRTSDETEERARNFEGIVSQNQLITGTRILMDWLFASHYEQLLMHNYEIRNRVYRELECVSFFLGMHKIVEQLLYDENFRKEMFKLRDDIKKKIGFEETRY